MDNPERGLKGLENWAKRVTAGYRNVNVQNMSTSFRDGLAFCAIIHHYRPDLIDFDSLSKENILENNSLAFSTAERQLGVPALLDAEDMVTQKRPDRLSICTYLAQLHNCFENQNKVKASIKRHQENLTGPPSKVSVVEPKLKPVKLKFEVCHVCNHRVFILERLIVDSKLYHTTCFRCNKCNCLLNPGAYVESDTPGLYECTVCLPEENSYSMDTHDTSYDSSESSLNNISSKPSSPIVDKKVSTKSPISETVNHARSSFLQNNLSKSPEIKRSSTGLKNGSLSIEDAKKEVFKDESTDNIVSVRDKISVFEPNRNSKPESFFKTSDLSNSSAHSPSSGVLSTASLTSNKSSGNSVISSDSFSNSVLSKTESTEKNSSSSSINVSLAKEIPISSINSTLQLNKTLDSSSDKPDCDNYISPSILNKVPNSNFRNSLQLQSSAKEEDTSKTSSSRPFQIGEYKSPFKPSRDIFQTNLQPLKLGIPPASSTPKKGSVSLPITPITTSPDSSRVGSIEIPQIKSTYARTLPRPGSFGNLLTKEPNSSSDSNAKNVFQSQGINSTRRRSSLESFSKSKVEAKEDAYVTSGSTKSLMEEKSNSSVMSPKERDTKFQYPGTLGRSSRSEVSSLRKEISDTPVPSIRHSLEIKKFNLTKTPEPTAEVNDSSVKSIKAVPRKVIQAAVTPQKSESETKTASNSKAVKATMATPSKPEKLYPDDLNPFGDEEDEEYPDDLNPFGDDDDQHETADVKVVLTNDYDESKNPFASDDDDTDLVTAPQPKPVVPKPTFSQGNSPFHQNSMFASMSSPTGSLKGTMKKRLAPKPPRVTDIFPNDSQDSEADTSLNSLKSSPALSRKGLQTPSPKLRKNKPAPPPPPVPPNRQTSQTDLTASSKQMKDEDNMKLKSTSAAAASNEAVKQVKRKKRPAPSVPIPMRKDNKKIPLKEILREMKEIEEKQRECERQGREIEILIRDRDKDEEPTVEEEEYIMQLFELVNQKNALFRRQAELMYIKRSQRLEEQQAEIERNIRELFEKPETEKNDDDKAREEELILELKDIVDQRSSIIDSIEMDRRRELEEDASVQEQIEIKNGDLPITAEIKEKNVGKVKKVKVKKEKKKKNQSSEIGESKKSSKKKGLFK